MAQFTEADAQSLQQCLHWLRVFVNENLGPVQRECNYIPEEISSLNGVIDAASDHINNAFVTPPGLPQGGTRLHISLADLHLPVYKQALIVGRQRIAADVERRGDHVHHGNLKSALQRELEPLDRLIEQKWFHDACSMAIPPLTDFLSLQRAEMLLERSEPETVLAPRDYDEKFHILQAPGLFQRDLRYFRKRCQLRGNSVAAAFIDIDDFKVRFNKPYGNDRVDRDVLPRFMETLESHVFGRGFAYRQGGDEYLILVPSVSLESGVDLLDELREKVANLKYAGIEEKTTVSIGVCVVGPGCFLTDNEVREKATKASAHAKEPVKEKPRKNCVATYRGERFRQEDLYVAAPA